VSQLLFDNVYHWGNTHLGPFGGGGSYLRVGLLGKGISLDTSPETSSDIKDSKRFDVVPNDHAWRKPWTSYRCILPRLVPCRLFAPVLRKFLMAELTVAKTVESTCWTAGVASGYTPASPACTVEQGRGYSAWRSRRLSTAPGRRHRSPRRSTLTLTAMGRTSWAPMFRRLDHGSLMEVGDFQLMRRLRPSLPLRPC
jgi:hypothetical protein